MTSEEPEHNAQVDPREVSSRFELSIARLLHEHYPDFRLRERVRKAPLLAQTKLGDILSDRMRYDAFMEKFQGLPQCGTIQVARLRQVLAQEYQTYAANSLSTLQPLKTAVASAVETAADTASHTAKCTFYPDFVEAVEDVFFRMWRLAHFEPFVYLPTSLPEYAKTSEVLAVELEPGRDLTLYLQRITSLRNTLERIDQADGVILLDKRALQAVFLREGRYAALSKHALHQQFQMLRDSLTNLPRGVSCRVCDFDTAGVSSGAFVGTKAVLSIMGGYVVFDDAQLVASVQSRLEFATRRSYPLWDFLHDNFSSSAQSS